MSEGAPIIIKKIKRGGRYHGGAWKVAYADFVTAMMAFFLVMWILGVATHEQKAAISQYFKNPSGTPGTATMAPPGEIGAGGPSDAVVDMGGGMSRPKGESDQRFQAPPAEATPREIDRRARELEKKRLESLRDELKAEIEASQALAPFKDQLLIDLTPEGLRIQIVDKQNRPMFDLGSIHLKDYTTVILGELGNFINRVPNRISITGHTDDARYSSERGYSNWELSTDRANAARRALVAGGLDDARVARVVGLAAEVPLDKANPADPINRRISILVMTKEAEDAALSRDVAGSRAISSPAAVAPSEPPTADAAPPQATPAGGDPAVQHLAPTRAVLPAPVTVQAASPQ